VADGQRTARAVLHLLRTGQASVSNRDAARPLDPYPQDVLDRLRRTGTMAVPPEPFADSEPQLTEREARREGDRCLGCGAGAVIDEAECAWCLTCLRVCPLDAVEISERMYADPVRCQSCGLCAAVCPASAISLSSWEVTLPPVGECGAETRGIALVCRHGDVDAPAGHDVLEVPCLGRLRPVELLRLFARGYSSVALCPCAAEDCKYGRAWQNVESLAGCVRVILATTRADVRLEVFAPQPARAVDAGPGGGKA
jgi:ferredoxin